ncbi:hypothetical protein ACQR1W_01905 [Bradyrhizobium sp. HKCCYLS1011]|uniref:hypothetical protein n=1 Tax=Bradyrhizobium sp. HKCCYLS1011 TaxID=3420733 RepID=UPI003EB6D45B
MIPGITARSSSPEIARWAEQMLARLGEPISPYNDDVMTIDRVFDHVRRFYGAAAARNLSFELIEH